MRQIGLADLERALQFDPGLAEAHLLVARLQSLPGGDRKRAMMAINELVKLTGDEPEKQSRSADAAQQFAGGAPSKDWPT